MPQKSTATKPPAPQEEYIQIGITALRTPSGEFLPATPLYVKATPELRAGEDKLINDIAGVFADKMKQYIDNGGLVPKTGKRQRTRSNAE